MNPVTTLDRVVRPYSEVVLDLYDKAPALDIVAAYAQRVPNPVPPGSGPGVTKGPKTVNLESSFADVLVLPYLGDESQSAAVAKIEWTVEPTRFSAAFSFDEDDLGRPETVTTVSGMLQRVGPAWANHEHRMAWEAIRGDGGVCYDNQTYWHTVHSHPVATMGLDGSGAFTNILTPNWSDPALPTLEEASAFLDAAASLLMANSIWRQEGATAAQYRQNLRVLCNSQASFGVFDALLSSPNLGSLTQPNRWFNRFVLDIDFNPTAGTETYVSVFHLPPGGPKPSFLVVDTAPRQLETWNETRKGWIAYGWRGKLGSKAFSPQVGVQGRPT